MSKLQVAVHQRVYHILSLVVALERLKHLAAVIHFANVAFLFGHRVPPVGGTLAQGLPHLCEFATHALQQGGLNLVSGLAELLLTEDYVRVAT